MGVRFCDRIVIVEKVGLYHTWTYIDGIEIYAFNGQKLDLVQKRDYDKTFRSEEFVRKETANLLQSYLLGVLKMQKSTMPEEQLEKEVQDIIDSCYKSYLDRDFNTRLTQILPQIESK